MSVRGSLIPHIARAAGFVLLMLTLAASLCPPARAQVIGTQSAVGGVLVDADGMLTRATLDDLGKLEQARRELTDAIPEDLRQTNQLLKISLRGLDEAIARCRDRGEPLPAEILCLGGLQKIRYVFVYPDENDVVLAGPAEAWKVNRQGAIVGATTGRPVLLLDDLVTALRAANGSVRTVISCSIDPTADGLRRWASFRQGLRPGLDPQTVAMAMERQLGPQEISVTGVPESSHYARVMVAADYRMKSIGMGFEPAPIPGLPSAMDLVPSRSRAAANMPRWWLAPDYEPLLRDAEGLSWEIRGGSVKAMAESDFLDGAGSRRHSGKADPASQRWANLMTERYDDLALADPVFGQLRNCMDLAVASALIAKENLLEKAQVSLPMLMGSAGVQTASLPAPKQVASRAQVTRKNRAMVACGGVEINPWTIVEHAETSDALAAVRTEAALERPAGNWRD